MVPGLTKRVFFSVFSTNGVNPDSIAKALRINIDEINKCYPISIVNAGLET